MTEAVLTKKCTRYARDNDVLCHKLDSATSRGWPDLILVFPGGRCEFVELKHPHGHGKLSTMQILTLKKLTDQGASVHVIDNFTDFKALIDKRAYRPAAGTHHRGL